MYGDVLRLVFSLVFLLPGWLYSQEVAEYQFVNIKEGITKAAVSTILQDHHGFIWLGTNGGGLYRFDGIDYTAYRHEAGDSTSLSSSLVISSFIDKENRLWVGTQDGLNLYHRDLDQFVRIPFHPEQKKAVLNIPVISILEDPDGTLLIGTFEMGHFKLDHTDSVIQKVPYNITSEIDEVTVNSIVVDHTQRVYSGSNLGLEEYNREKSFYGLVYLNTEEGLVPFEKPVQTLLIDKENALWVGTLADGLYKIERGDATRGVYDKISHYNITDKRILSIIQLNDGTLMIGTENEGLIHIMPNGNLLSQYLHDRTVSTSILSNSIWSLFLDQDERIWLGTYNSGVGVYDKLYDKFEQLESPPNVANSLANGSVTGLVQDGDGKIWISMDGGGIDTYDPISGKVDHIGPAGERYKGLEDHYIQTIFIDSKKNLWAGTWNNGLFLLKSGSLHFENHSRENHPEVFESNRVLSFDEDADGTIWIGTFDDGIVSYHPGLERFTRHTSTAFVNQQLHNSDVRKVLVDSRNNLWVGTTEGLFKIKKSGTGEFSIESMTQRMVKSNENRTSANHILSLYEDSTGRIWIGTMGSGLSSYHENDNEFISYNERYNLEEETVVSIIESNGEIWISGNSGICRINLSDNGITNYTSSDGLLSNDFNFNSVLKDAQGNLYFGNYKGVDFFDPASIAHNQVVPSIYLTGLKVFNQDVVPNRKGSPLKRVISETDSISLNHKQSVFTIEYTGINYTRPEKNQYAYYLEGLEDSWNYVGGQRNATYTNLNPGEYSFKLKASNNDGAWNETPLELKITILPPWWKTNTALMAYLVFFLFSIYLLNKFTRERLEQKAVIRRERDQRLREEKLHEQKLQFFTNISHEFRTPLTLIINPLKDIIADESLRLPDKVKAKHNIIFRNTDRLYRLINELMDFRKLEHNKVNIKAQKLDLIAVVDEVVGYFREELEQKSIHLSIESDFPEIFIWADHKMLEKIVFNILSNAMQVTPERGAISIYILSKDVLDKLPLVDQTEPTETIQIIISDTGPGLTKKQAKKIFQRFYQVENLNNTYYGGTGIGLEVVRSFVHLHRGKVDVTSKVGEGTSFKVALPKGNNHFKQEELLGALEKDAPGFSSDLTRTQLPSIEDKLASASSSRKSHTLLIIEDNPELRNYLNDELREIYNILIAKNGVEGLKIARDALPDVILTDVIMPEMDGYKLCKLIKQDLRTSHIPLLMLTAKTKTESRIKGIEMGADAFIVKPFEMRLLKLRLDQLVTSRQIIFDKYFSKISGVSDNKNATSLDKEFIQKVLQFIHDNISDQDLSVELLSSQLNLSRSQMYRKVKTLTGLTVNEFLRKVRLQQARRLIETEPGVNISDVCYRVGFSTPSYFTKCFKSQFGVLPTEIDTIVDRES